ncbi:fumarylacetoacetate hydrolase family protein [Neorhizobium sp. JUb45]|uniref:fumarylacetoacetate hydrolase family protein n=1 Tax=Neorhizobium sp. JUb45 TaxID=2485113 RepID=UPI00104FEE38|nr:fumarylacetoacetate hydrolase family protein [Neorhizobium sp. JUb45]TCQ99067.1 2-keto-4-pentenoate hydratase/2-oxohepta-3-ene-1,7-dioic acid hydratase in catechol pathway [Neorhizobium sp. JUb45]
MRLTRFLIGGQLGLAIGDGGTYRGWLASDERYPGDLSPALLKDASFGDLGGKLSAGPEIHLESATFLPPFAGSSKMICVGLNYVDHSAETGFKVPDYPTVFPRFASSLIGHLNPIIKPATSDQLDYEGEVAVILSKGGRYISEADALGHVLGYSVFNDASIRDYQLRTPQWTIGKNFDGTGAFGPALVTADELPLGAAGLSITTRLNGTVVQNANTNDLVFSVAKLISDLSKTMTLEPGDAIITGTPAGVGAGRKPPLWMKHGDVCEVEVEGIGLLRNTVKNEDAGSGVDNGTTGGRVVEYQ